ncbi:MAG: PBP1A family penicillin-binding protein [Alphaproteobacteria bacterium]|nr:PBP1A family penicillin-binding protein [Alphaproteobacteria bacterium]
MLRNILIGIGALAGVVTLGLAGFTFMSLQGLPDYEALREYEPPITSRVHAGDGALVAEFAREHRIFVPIEAIPDRVQSAFIAAEDQNFRSHRGVDPRGVLRATISNVSNVLRGRRLEGASTITQQVSGNMLTGRDRSLSRKVREAVLAMRIEQALDKERILELYLNQIYLGNRAYGVAAAALNYFDKSLNDLTLGEAAFLAVLPKGPANYDPRDPAKLERALGRRAYVLNQMQEQGFITAEEAQAAREEPIQVVDRLSGDRYIASAHFVEEVRRQLVEQLGEDAILSGGLSIRSTIDTRMQVLAANALRRGLEQYDRRHSWRGPVAQGDAGGDIQAQLRAAAAPPSLTGWRRAMVTSAQGNTVQITLDNGETGRLDTDDPPWAARAARSNRDRALRAGSIIYVEQASGSRYRLHQLPEIQGALVAMDPHTGRVLAMVGGYNFSEAGFNRATQARRQPGSSFKPIVYAAGLETPPTTPDQPQLTPATLIEDGPLAISAGDGSVWSPENYTREFYGPTTLRRGLEQSRNAMTARVAVELGPERVLDYGRRLGVYDDRTQPVFALALGAGETTLMRMTTAYGMFVNGGRRITPILVDRVQDRHGENIFTRDQRACDGCRGEWRRQGAPRLPDAREQVLNPITAYQIVSMTEGVVQRGTATALNSLNRPLGGKTGTTNDYKDAWFIGYSPDLVVGVWVGFDEPRNMGEGETGGRISVPIFRDFMGEALRGQPATPFRIPSGVRLVRVDARTGLLPGAETTDTIIEAFRPGTEPTIQVASSPFIFGGTAPIDPRVFGGYTISRADETGSTPASTGAAPPPQQSSTPLDQLY